MTTATAPSLYALQQDPEAEARLMERIRKDVSQVGVPSIQGSVTKLPDGWFFDDLAVEVSHPGFYHPIKIGVAPASADEDWDADTGEIVYTNALGKPVNLSSNPYATEQTDPERDIVAKVMSRLNRRFRAVEGRVEEKSHQVDLRFTQPFNAKIVGDAQVGLLAILITVGLFVLSELANIHFVELALVVGSTFLAAALAVEIIFGRDPDSHKESKQEKEARKLAAAHWDSNLGKVFYDTFANSVEQRVFINAARKIGAAAGVTNLREFSACETHGENASSTTVDLTASREDGTPVNIAFDGRFVYEQRAYNAEPIIL